MATPPFFSDLFGATPTSPEPALRAHSYVLAALAAGAFLTGHKTVAKALAGGLVADTVARQVSPWYAGHVACHYKATSWAELVACHTGKGASGATITAPVIRTVEAFRAGNIHTVATTGQGAGAQVAEVPASYGYKPVAGAKCKQGFQLVVTMSGASARIDGPYDDGRSCVPNNPDGNGCYQLFGADDPKCLPGETFTPTGGMGAGMCCPAGKTPVPLPTRSLAENLRMLGVGQPATRNLDLKGLGRVASLRSALAGFMES